MTEHVDLSAEKKSQAQDCPGADLCLSGCLNTSELPLLRLI